MFPRYTANHSSGALITDGWDAGIIICFIMFQISIFYLQTVNIFVLLRLRSIVWISLPGAPLKTEALLE